MLIWARKLTAWAERKGKAARELEQEDAQAFLTHRATSPKVAAWQVEQAADSTRVLVGGVFGQEWDRNRMGPKGRSREVHSEFPQLFPTGLFQ
jgi:hypothetical protein